MSRVFHCFILKFVRKHDHVKLQTKRAKLLLIMKFSIYLNDITDSQDFEKKKAITFFIIFIFMSKWSVDLCHYTPRHEK